MSAIKKMPPKKAAAGKKAKVTAPSKKNKNSKAKKKPSLDEEDYTVRVPARLTHKTTVLYLVSGWAETSHSQRNRASQSVQEAADC